MSKSDLTSFEHALELYITAEHDCPYLEERRAINLLVDPTFLPSGEQYEVLIEKGFRRSGRHIYRPSCRRCSECVSTRIPVDFFKQSRSQKRNWRLNQDLSVHINRSKQLTVEHEQLYNAYIKERHYGGGMDGDSLSDVANFLFSSWSETVLLEVREQERLLAVAVTDCVPNGISAVYTFYEPQIAHQRGLGTFCLLWQIHWVQSQGLEYVYPGYWIKASNKMNYKTRFQPIEGLIDGRWVKLAK